jgi:hypothetical protein
MSEDDVAAIESRRICSDNDPREPTFVSMMDPYFRLIPVQSCEAETGIVAENMNSRDE